MTEVLGVDGIAPRGGGRVVIVRGWGQSGGVPTQHVPNVCQGVGVALGALSLVARIDSRVGRVVETGEIPR